MFEDKLNLRRDGEGERSLALPNFPDDAREKDAHG
jgi:hypothetical protein